MHLLVYITIPDRDKALAISSMLVEKRLAAGVNLTGPLQSVYHWQGKIRQRQEWLLFAQTMQENFADLEQLVKQMHPDLVPCIIAMPIACGHVPFLNWINSECGRLE